MPVITGEKTPGERFPGARRTYTLEAMMRDGRALQAGTSHYMGTNFARVFNIQYAAESGELELCHTTSWGMTTRMIGGVIMTHGDDKGLILPPLLAPYQVVIVPIGRGEQAGQVLPPARELAARLHNAGIRDARGRPAAALSRLQVQRLGDARRPDPAGARPPGSGRRLRTDVTPGSAQGKTPVSLDSVPARLQAELAAFQSLLLRRATEFRDSRTRTVNSWAEFAEAVKTGWALALHCGTQECEDDIKAATTATPRCIPTEGPAEEGRCVRCGLPSAYRKRLIFGRAY